MTDLVYKILLALVLLAAIGVVAFFLWFENGIMDPVVTPPTGKAPIAATPTPEVPATPAATEEPAGPLPGDDVVACTQDALECPDGTFVGRVPPSCEFAPCPGN